MYLVRQQGKTIRKFRLFVDAWLFVYLECECYALILGPRQGEVWIVNPAYNPANRPIN